MRWRLLLVATIRAAIIRETPVCARHSRLSWIMNMTILAAAFVFPLVLAPWVRIVMLTLHSGMYLLPSTHGMEVVRRGVAVDAGTALSGNYGCGTRSSSV